MYRLKKWYLEQAGGGFIGYGDCYGNPRFFNGEFIHTSYVVKAEVEDEENRMKLFTFSGSCYVLDFADINEVCLESTKKVLESRGIAVGLQKCIALKKQKEEDTKKKLAEILKPNELYVVMTGGRGVSEAYFKTKDGAVVPVPAVVHISMVQDSIIVSKAGLCDWRIFPSDISVEPYHWSDYLDAVRIENAGDDFVFRGSERVIPCRSGEITVIKSKEYMGEGLFSPDAVNGKCLWPK